MRRETEDLAQMSTWRSQNVFRSPEGSTDNSPLSIGVETVLWHTTGEKVSKWYQRILEASAWSIVRWHADEAKKIRQRHACVVDGVQGEGKWGGGSRETV